MSFTTAFRGRALPLAAALASVLLMTACGGGGDDSPEPARPAANPKPTTTVTTCSDAGKTAAAASALPSVVCMLTSDGEIVVELDSAKAPLTVANFLKLVDAKFYDNTLIHRVSPGFVAQGGGLSPGYVRKNNGYATIKLETKVGLTNARGTIGMARGTTADSATTEFFFNTVDNNVPGTGNNLDYIDADRPGYATFGRIISGLGTLDAINAEKQLRVGEEVPATEVIVYWVQKLK